MRRLLTILLALLPLTEAVAQKCSLNCTLTGLGDGVGVVVCEPHGNRLAPVDTLTPDGKGRIKIERYSNDGDAQFFALALTRPQSPILHVMLLPKEKVNMDIAYNPAHNVLPITRVKGSANMEMYRRYTDIMAEVTANPELQAAMPDAMEALIRGNSKELMSAFLVTYFEAAFDEYYDLYKTVRDSTITRYANNDFVKHVDQKVRSVIAVGSEAPDIVMAGRDGKELRLSDLRGKVVLIDFWASWCRPCRAENPNVVRLYNRYHDRGFEIFSVSLDNNRDAWLRAIEADGLVWSNHVSDLRGWSSAAGRLYGISSIPATVLVDREGRVLARNLRGQQLEQKLKEIFGQ